MVSMPPIPVPMIAPVSQSGSSPGPQNDSAFNMRTPPTNRRALLASFGALN
jgi:hypothetical protein